jgi:hypothetical protein
MADHVGIWHSHGAADAAASDSGYRAYARRGAGYRAYRIDLIFDADLIAVIKDEFTRADAVRVVGREPRERSRAEVPPRPAFPPLAAPVPQGVRRRQAQSAPGALPLTQRGNPIAVVARSR